jgi:hypothetical protein
MISVLRPSRAIDRQIMTDHKEWESLVRRAKLGLLDFELAGGSPAIQFL